MGVAAVAVLMETSYQTLRHALTLASFGLRKESQGELCACIDKRWAHVKLKVKRSQNDLTAALGEC